MTTLGRIKKIVVAWRNAAQKMMVPTTSEVAGAMQHSYSVGLSGVQDYNKKWIEFAQANTKATMDFVQSMFGVKSPSEFIERSTEHAQKQLTTLTAQTQQLAELAQRAAFAAAEPLKTEFTKAAR